MDSQHDKAILFEYLRLYTEEEQFWIDAHQNKINYYTGLLTGISGAISFGIYNAVHPVHFLVVCGAALGLIAIVYYSEQAISRPFQRFMEAVTMRAKVEQMLGLHDLKPGPGAIYWRDEGLVPARHILSRKVHSSSIGLIGAAMGGGFPRIQRRISALFQIFGATSFVVGIILLIQALSTTTQ